MNRRLVAYAQLVRLPNLFTALADIGLGWFVTRAPWPAALAAAAISACCYCAGMVWNDVFDVGQDERERPFRPLPSGRVSTAAARRLGGGLFAAALAVAGLADFAAESLRFLPLTVLLAGAVLLYDRVLKRTRFGPLGMGACRFLNVLLGLAAADSAAVPWPLRLHLAAVVGLYIVGVTWFARTEARASDPKQLRLATGTMAAALALALALPLHLAEGAGSPLFVYALVGFALTLAGPVSAALAKPGPGTVQPAVKRPCWGWSCSTRPWRAAWPARRGWHWCCCCRRPCGSDNGCTRRNRRRAGNARVEVVGGLGRIGGDCNGVGGDGCRRRDRPRQGVHGRPRRQGAAAGDRLVARLVGRQHHRRRRRLQAQGGRPEQARRGARVAGRLRRTESAQGGRRRGQDPRQAHRPRRRAAVPAIPRKAGRAGTAEADDGQGQRGREGVQRPPRQGGRQGDDRQRGAQGLEGVEELRAAQGRVGGEQGRSARPSPAT